MMQGQNSRLLPVNSGASLSSIVTSIYNAVPSGATYSPPSSVSLGVSTDNTFLKKLQLCLQGNPSFECIIIAKSALCQQLKFELWIRVWGERWR